MGSKGLSHSSRPATRLSPHVVVQIEGVSVQVQPSSTLQLMEHPSFSFMFKSSHFSVPFNRPSPQFGRQTEGRPKHVKPSSHLQV